MRLIDATELEREWERIKAKDQYNGGGYLYSPQDLLDSIEEAETIEAEPVKHGRWTVLDECANAGAYCSVCHKKVYKECYGNCKMRSAYCPNCGAKMDGGAE